MVSFKEFLLRENVGSDLILAKAVSEQGLKSILSGGFKLQDKHASTLRAFDKYGDTDDDQMYGPGIYFSVPFSFNQLKKDCKKYADSWGSYIVIATLNGRGKILVNSTLPENHSIWRHTIVDRNDSMFQKLQKLGVSLLFPDYKPNDIHFKPEYGYRLAKGKVDGWVHEHNMIPHAVIYNPSVLKYVSYFKCGEENAQNNKQLPAFSTKKATNNNQNDSDLNLDLDLNV